MKKLNIIYFRKFVHWLKGKQAPKASPTSKSIEVRIKSASDTFKEHDFGLLFKGRTYELMGRTKTLDFGQPFPSLPRSISV